MAGHIDGVEIESYDFGTDVGRPPHPVDHGVDAAVIGQVLAERPPVGRPNAVDRHFRTGPEHGRGPDSLLFGGDPDRLGLAPPERVLGRHFEYFAGPGRVFHRVADNAVMVRSLAGHQSPVIGKGLAREGRAHRTVDAGRCQCLQIGGDPPFQIVWTEAVDRDQDRDRIAGFCLFADRLILLGRGCGQRGRGGQ